MQPSFGKRLYDATWGRGFAALYDRSLQASEEAGLADARHRLLEGARGRTLELGAGTGLNLRHYPDGVTHLTLTEPDLQMAAHLRKRLAGVKAPIEIIRAPAEELPFDDGTFDTVVATLVFCTVSSPEAALTEVRRVLRPGGSLLFLEHVRADEDKLAKWQDRLNGIWQFVADGCNCNRDPLGPICRHLKLEDVRLGDIPKAPSIVRPMVVGTARVAVDRIA